ncbi:metacaspase protein [Rhizoctonia solani]|uniref:Metacaspase protein n=1 Tax=Rhizoctonia solani TaxID=456999 RepID=A0A8H8SVU2_9AGAM|nr:metacaspase protein [Rhizoctonia solani]QRW19854.1 metacaspase protein [Rhizoctonia solani]
MAFPLCWTSPASPFKPLGGSPTISLTQDLSPDQSNVDILILECNDVYNILYTLYADVFVGPDPRKIDITCSEKEPAVIARNILFFTLLYEKAAVEQIWNIYYHFKIDESTSALLTAHSRKLADASVALSAWSQSPYSSLIKIVNQDTLDKIHNIWTKYANFPELPNQMLQDIKAKQSKLASAMLKSTGSDQNIRVSRSTTLVWPQSAIEVSDEFKRFWRTGTTNKPSSNEDRLNPAWIYSGKNEEWSVYSTSFPEVFHLVEAFLPDKRDPRKKLPTCLDKARQQFKLACESFQVSLRTEKLTLRFYTGDPLCFSLALQSSSELIPQYIDPWDAKPIDLTHHFSLSPPRQFEIIDATRFIDTHGLWNLIIAIQPLLASTSSILYTEAHTPSDQYAPITFYERICSDLPTFSLISGLVPRAFISEFQSQSNSHEINIFDEEEHEQRVAWVSADPCPPSVPLGVKFSVTDIADALFYIYRGMHFFDDSPEYFEPVPLSRLRVWSQLPYNRETVARIVRHVQSRGQIHLVGGMWEDVANRIIHLVQGNKLTYQDDRHLEDLKLQFQLCDFLPLPNPPTPVGIFAGWSEVPPVVCLVLKIPASANELKVLKDYGESIQPRLTCIIRKSANDNKPQMFSSLHAVWGTLVPSEDAYSIEPDRSGQETNGSSDMIVSFWISSALIAGNETTVSLAFRYTSLSHRLYHRSLGHDLDIFKAQVKDQKHVLVLRSRPMQAPFKQSLPLLPAPPPPSSNATCESRLDVTDPEEKISLAGGAKVSMQLEGPCRLRLSIGDYTHAVSIPFPAKESDIRLRIARKSSYIEAVTTPYQPWYAGGYPPSPFPILSNPPRPWNVHHIPLDKLPLIELSDTEAMETYILPHMALQHSDRERKIMFDPNYVPRDHIHALKVGINILIHDYIGFKFRGPPFEVFALRPVGSGVQMVLLVGGMRSDSSGGTIVLDTAVIPVTNENKSMVLPLLDPIGESGVLIMSVDVQHGEMGAWKQYLAACIERVRTWTHKPECEYQAAGQAPISLQDGEDSICACGNGIGFEGKEWIPPEAPKWQQLLPYATRAGVSPIFSVPYLEIVGGEVFKDTGTLVGIMLKEYGNRVQNELEQPAQGTTDTQVMGEYVPRTSSATRNETTLQSVEQSHLPNVESLTLHETNESELS